MERGIHSRVDGERGQDRGDGNKFRVSASEFTDHPHDRRRVARRVRSPLDRSVGMDHHGAEIALLISSFERPRNLAYVLASVARQQCPAGPHGVGGHRRRVER